MIKILLVMGNNIESGGAENYLLNALNQINRDDLQIDVLVPGIIISTQIAERFLERGCRFHVLKIRQNGIRKDWELFKKTRKILLREKYDIIHVNTANLRVESICLLLANMTGVKIRVAHSHGTSVSVQGKFFKRIFRNVRRRIILANANEFLACSRLAAEALVGRKHCDRIQIARNGIDAKKYSYNQEVRNKIRYEYECDDKFVIGFIARISPEKNHLFILRVMREIVAHNENSLLMLIGAGEESCVREVKEEVARLQLQKYVMFLGEKNNVYELVQGMDVHVLPSTREALGIVNIEAQAAGLHCICSDIVPREVDVTGLTDFIPLEKGEKYWAEKILQYSNGYERKDTVEMIIEHGYDISSSTRILNEIYHNKKK